MAKRLKRGKYYSHVEPKLVEIEGWARDGLIDEQIAKNLGVAYSTFRRYRDEHKALSAALKNGKEVVDRQVENALLKRALGYKFEEVTKEREFRKDPETGESIEVMAEVKRVTKEVQPDTTAQIFWLKNRRPDRWRDRKDIDANVNHTNNPFKEISTEDLKKLIED